MSIGMLNISDLFTQKATTEGLVTFCRAMKVLYTTVPRIWMC